jgi:hypothetical protein
MSLDEIPPSSHAASQAWFSMMLANDPNTALVASLRPRRQSSLWAALRRPFEQQPPLALERADEMPGLRPRSARWLGVGLLLALGMGLAAQQHERLGALVLGEPPAAPARPQLNVVSSPGQPAHAALEVTVHSQTAQAITANLVPLAREPSLEPAAAVPRSAPSAKRAPSPKGVSSAKPVITIKKKAKKPAARSPRKELKQSLSGGSWR